MDFTQLEVSRATIAFCADAGHPCRGRDHRVRPRPTWTTWPQLVRRRPAAPAAELHRGRQLRHRRRAHDAVRRDGRPVVRRRRDHRAAPRGQAGRPVGHVAAHGRGDGRGPGRRRSGRVPPGRHGDRGRAKEPGAERARAASGCTPSASPDWSPTRRSSSASAGQGLTIRHDSYDRASFMDGVVLAVESVAARPGADRRASSPSSGSEARRAVDDTASGSSRPPTPAWPVAAWPRRRSRTWPGRPAISRATVYRAFPGGRDELDQRHRVVGDLRLLRQALRPDPGRRPTWRR